MKAAAIPGVLGLVTSLLVGLFTVLSPKPDVPKPPDPPPIVIDPKPPAPDDTLANLQKLIESLKIIIDALQKDAAANKDQIAALESQLASLRADNPDRPPVQETTHIETVPAVLPTKQTVTIYWAPWCAACVSMHNSDWSNEPYDVVWINTDEIKSGFMPASIPLTKWVGSDSKPWQVTGGPYTPKQITGTWKTTQGGERKQPVQQGKLCQCVAVTGNRQAYCPCLPLGRGCHCSPSKPHRFD